MIVSRLYTDDVHNSTLLNAIFDEPAFRQLTKEHSKFYGTHTTNILKTIIIRVHTFTQVYLGFILILHSYLFKIVEINSTLKFNTTLSGIFVSFVIMIVILYYVSYIYCASVHREQEDLIYFEKVYKNLQIAY